MIIKRHMDEEILELRGMIADISTAVRGMLDLCIKPLAELTGDDFDRVFDLEIDVNRYQIKIDDLAWKIMALYQPTASDLRLLIGAIKISSDFERAGDQLCTLCRRIVELKKQGCPEYPATVLELQVMVRSLFRDGCLVIDSLQEEMAEAIFMGDDTIDEVFENLFQSLRKEMKKGPDEVDINLNFLAVARALEHVADMACNLAEVAIFMKKGLDVRHHGMGKV
ncbi:hypothetical protein AUK22_02935 [bacterium CG2_30_54_10]|nr:MAG: hypothetical protein AUK22_02935 [bacterium CG2_30_54_10]